MSQEDLSLEKLYSGRVMECDDLARALVAAREQFRYIARSYVIPSSVKWRCEEAERQIDEVLKAHDLLDTEEPSPAVVGDLPNIWVGFGKQPEVRDRMMSYLYRHKIPNETDPQDYYAIRVPAARLEELSRQFELTRLMR